MRCCSTPTSIYGLWTKGDELECNNDQPLQTPPGKSNNRIGHIGLPSSANSMIRVGASFHGGDSALPPRESQDPGPVQGCWFFILGEFLFRSRFLEQRVCKGCIICLDLREGKIFEVVNWNSVCL